MADVIDLSTDDSMIVQLNSVGHGPANVMNLTKQPFRMRVLWAEVSHKLYLPLQNLSLWRDHHDTVSEIPVVVEQSWTGQVSRHLTVNEGAGLATVLPGHCL